MSTSDQRAPDRFETATRPRSATADHARRRPARRRPHRAARADHRAVRHLGDGWPAAGRAVPQRRLRERSWRSRTATRWPRSPTPPSAGLRSAVGAIFILLAVGGAHRHLEHGRHDPDRSSTTASRCSARPGSTSPTCAHLRAVGMVTGSSWTTAGTLGVALRRHGPRARPERGDGRRRDPSAAPTSATRSPRRRRRRSSSRSSSGAGSRSTSMCATCSGRRGRPSASAWSSSSSSGWRAEPSGGLDPGSRAGRPRATPSGSHR